MILILSDLIFSDAWLTFYSSVIAVNCSRHLVIPELLLKTREKKTRTFLPSSRHLPIGLLHLAFFLSGWMVLLTFLSHARCISSSALAFLTSAFKLLVFFQHRLKQPDLLSVHIMPVFNSRMCRPWALTFIQVDWWENSWPHTTSLWSQGHALSLVGTELQRLWVLWCILINLAILMSAGSQWDMISSVAVNRGCTAETALQH